MKAGKREEENEEGKRKKRQRGRPCHHAENYREYLIILIVRVSIQIQAAIPAAMSRISAITSRLQPGRHKQSAMGVGAWVVA